LDGPPLGDSAGVLDSAGEQQQPLFDALSSEGLISITDIPGFAPLKKSLMQWLHTCIIDQGPNDYSKGRDYTPYYRKCYPTWTKRWREL
jgi:hypothetical protein